MSAFNSWMAAPWPASRIEVVPAHLAGSAVAAVPAGWQVTDSWPWTPTSPLGIHREGSEFQSSNVRISVCMRWCAFCTVPCALPYSASAARFWCPGPRAPDSRRPHAGGVRRSLRLVPHVPESHRERQRQPHADHDPCIGQEPEGQHPGALRPAGRGARCRTARTARHSQVSARDFPRPGSLTVDRRLGGLRVNPCLQAPGPGRSSSCPGPAPACGSHAGPVPPPGSRCPPERGRRWQRPAGRGRRPVAALPRA